MKGRFGGVRDVIDFVNTQNGNGALNLQGMKAALRLVPDENLGLRRGFRRRVFRCFP